MLDNEALEKMHFSGLSEAFRSGNKYGVKMAILQHREHFNSFEDEDTLKEIDDDLSREFDHFWSNKVDADHELVTGPLQDLGMDEDELDDEKIAEIEQALAQAESEHAQNQGEVQKDDGHDDVPDDGMSMHMKPGKTMSATVGMMARSQILLHPLLKDGNFSKS